MAFFLRASTHGEARRWMVGAHAVVHGAVFALARRPAAEKLDMQAAHVAGGMNAHAQARKHAIASALRVWGSS